MGTDWSQSDKIGKVDGFLQWYCRSRTVLFVYHHWKVDAAGRLGVDERGDIPANATISIPLSSQSLEREVSSWSRTMFGAKQM